MSSYSKVVRDRDRGRAHPYLARGSVGPTTSPLTDSPRTTGRRDGVDRGGTVGTVGPLGPLDDPVVLVPVDNK